MDLSVVILKRIKSLTEEERERKTLEQNPELKKFVQKLELVCLEEAYNYVARAEAKMRG